MQYLYMPPETLCQDFIPPYTCQGDSSEYPDGDYTLIVTAYDVAGNSSSESIAVTLHKVDYDNPHVDITQPLNGAVVSGPTAVCADASDATSGIDTVEYYIDGTYFYCLAASEPYCCEIDLTTVPAGPYQLVALARDLAGNEDQDSISINIESDQTPPIVTITAPSDGAVVSGIVTGYADASDNESGMDRVEFFIPELSDDPICVDYTETYSCEVDTTTVPNGVYTVVADAYDRLNNVASDSISATVDNPIGCQQWTATNSEHAAEGRAYRSWFVYYAVGSDDRLGYSSTTTTVYETGSEPGVFRLGECP